MAREIGVPAPRIGEIVAGCRAIAWVRQPTLRHDGCPCMSRGVVAPQIEAMRRILRGETLVSVNETVEIERSWPHGHVAAVLGTLRHIGLERVLASRGSPERDRVVGMLVARILAPDSKLATARAGHRDVLQHVGVGVGARRCDGTGANRPLIPVGIRPPSPGESGSIQD